MAHWMAQVVLPYFTNIPRDVSVNTLHFDVTTSDSAATAQAIATATTQLYNLSAVGRTNPIAYYIAGVVSRTANAARVKIYNMDLPKPRPPILEHPWTLGPAASGNNLPLEVSIVSSFQGDLSAGVPQARRRGRVYLGPLGAHAVSQGSGSAFPQVVEGVRLDIAGAFSDYSSAIPVATDGDAQWCVWSRVNSDLVRITNGWVNNEPDTQRRRQSQPTSRSTWSNNV